MTKEEIENIAWSKGNLPTDAAKEDKLYFYAVSKIYDDVRTEAMTRSDAREFKESFKEFFDRQEALKPVIRSNTKLIVELDKLTAPRADLVMMDKSQLLDVIHKMEGLLCGLMKTAEDVVPDFLK